MADGQQVEGVDYAFPPRPNIQQLASGGKLFACRYGGPGSSDKQLDPAEAQALSAAGVAIVANAEGVATGLKLGYSAGRSWALDAEAHFRACGMPPGRPIYFSVDFDTTSGDWAALDAAMDGAASVIGRERVGVYGEYSIIEHFAANRKAVWFWQTYAWSGGRWSAHNHIEQYKNGVPLAGAVLDLDRALASDFGQWTTGVDDVDQYHEEAILFTDNRVAALIEGWDEVRGTDTAGQGAGAQVFPVKALKELLARPVAPSAEVDIPALVEALRPMVAQESEIAVRRALGGLDGATPA